MAGTRALRIRLEDWPARAEKEIRRERNKSFIAILSAIPPEFLSQELK